MLLTYKPEKITHTGWIWPQYIFVVVWILLRSGSVYWYTYIQLNDTVLRFLIILIGVCISLTKLLFTLHILLLIYCCTKLLHKIDVPELSRCLLDILDCRNELWFAWRSGYVEFVSFLLRNLYGMICVS